MNAQSHVSLEHLPLVVPDELTPFTGVIQQRLQRYRAAQAALDGQGGPRGLLTSGHHYFGFIRGTHAGTDGIWYREWAPNAHAVALTGDFNAWNRDSHPLHRDEWGVWHRFFPDSEGLKHRSRVKVHVHGADGSVRDRIPAYIQRVVQEPPVHGSFVAEVWLPSIFAWQNERPQLSDGEGLRIYETHVGMALEDGRVGNFAEFTEQILPRIVALGYNAVQLMAVAEHPYYGSFGYHVSSFYAVSSRFGTPDDLKRLIDAAHGKGLLVFLDLVHSHAVKNVYEGLNEFDGTDYQYFHSGERGSHPAWDSMLFDYGKWEVQRFLLSNIRYWLEEFRFDGFRFDGVTSMLYGDHGLNRVFTGYHDYFGDNVTQEAVTYLQLANYVAHAIRPNAVTIAEEVSGMPGTARPVSEGGLGFDYRLAMGVPDYWIKLLKEYRDEDWNLADLWHTLLNRRHDERHVAYAESHDQALVGDQSLAFRMMGPEMYTSMAQDRRSIIIDRGIALHKIIRLLTFSLAGDAWLNFMGNEFGHPEWIDFPREGNGWSYHYARRQWSLADNADLSYAELGNFDQAVMELDRQYHLLTNPLIELLFVHEDAKILVYRRGRTVFAVNLHTTNAVLGWRVPVPEATEYCVVLNTQRSSKPVSPEMECLSVQETDQVLTINLESRSAKVFVPASLIVL